MGGKAFYDFTYSTLTVCKSFACFPDLPITQERVGNFFLLTDR